MAPELLIKGVKVVRTAKGSGHVLVTTADQVNLDMDMFDWGCILLICILLAKKLIYFGGKKS